MSEGVGTDGEVGHTSTQPTQEEERAVSFRGDGVKDGVEEERVRACMGVAWVRGVMWEGVKKGGRCWWWVQRAKQFLTEASPVVTHQSTNSAHRCLTSACR